MKCVAISLLLLLLFAPVSTLHAAEPLRVMTFNLAVGGEWAGRPLEDTAAVIRAAEPDVVGLQETQAKTPRDGSPTPNNGARLAKLLGDDWHFLAQPGNCGVLTRLAIVRPSADKHGALLRTAGGREVWLFNVHLPAAPYQPYQLCGIKYHPDAVMLSTEVEAIAAARSARGKQVDALVDDLRAERALDADAVFVTGDFNEPSHQDWTDAAVRAGHCPVAVAFPSTKALADLGLVDAYRTVHPDPVTRPGHTWTPMTDPAAPRDRHDRIDFVFVGGRGGATVEVAEVVGEGEPAADLVVRPWPSDHRAVVATVRVAIPKSGARGE